MTWIDKLARRFLFGPPEPRTTFGIVKWWEFRRIPYNLLVGVTGMSSLFLFFFFSAHSGELTPGEDPVEPLAIAVGAVFAIVAANVLYTAGWIIELILRNMGFRKPERIAPALFTAGLVLTVALIMLPAGCLGVVFLVDNLFPDR